MRPKEYLVSIGALSDPNQRGRLSKDNLALIHKALAEGVKIDGYTVDTSKPTAEGEVPKVTRTEVGGIADIGDETRPEKSWEAYYTIDGERHSVGMRTVCNTCGSSLTYCHCRTPYVWHDHDRQGLVNFAMRTKPLPARPWA